MKGLVSCDADVLMVTNFRVSCLFEHCLHAAKCKTAMGTTQLNAMHTVAAQAIQKVP